LNSMLMLNATDVRKNWSQQLDIVSRAKPLFIKRIRESFILSDTDTLKNVLSAYKYNAHVFIEDDNSCTISADDLDIVENAETKDAAVEAVQKSIYEYAVNFYNEFNFWSSAQNRKSHVPYILKALLCDSTKELELNIIA